MSNARQQCAKANKKHSAGRKRKKIQNSTCSTCLFVPRFCGF